MLQKSAFIVVLLLLLGCIRAPDSLQFKPSKQIPKYTQSSFDAYVKETRQWLNNNRFFITNDKIREINANAPFELQPKNPAKKSKGVLLVHGLGDSPYSFVDIAPLLAEQGFLVRVILLPGHGSKPADLLWPEVNDWGNIVAHHTQLLQSEVDEVWLGGFSTGGNLVTSMALKDESIKGLILFSPAFKPVSGLIWLSPFISKFMDWIDVDPEDNFVRYDSLTFKALGEYYKTSKQVIDDLENKAFDRPVLITISATDSVINPQLVLHLFETRFNHPDSKLLWYGSNPGSKDNRVTVINANIPEQRISNFSHMAALFAPDNPHYGKNGEYRLCNNGQGGALESQCQTKKELWYSAYGYFEEGKIHARLTWNPFFQNLSSQLKMLMK